MFFRVTCLEFNWLIEWLGFNAVFNIFQSYHGDQFTYSCVSWFSHTSTPHNILSKQLAAFPHRLLASPLVKDKWRMSQWLWSNVGQNVGRAGIQTHNPWETFWEREVKHAENCQLYGLDIAWKTLCEGRNCSFWERFPFPAIWCL